MDDQPDQRDLRRSGTDSHGHLRDLGDHTQRVAVRAGGRARVWASQQSTGPGSRDVIGSRLVSLQQHEAFAGRFGPVEDGWIGRHTDVAPRAQLALAWLLAQNRWIVPIPARGGWHASRRASARLPSSFFRTIYAISRHITAHGARYPEVVER